MKPFRRSRSRRLMTGTSTVRRSARYPAARARSTNERVRSRFCHTYSWNQSGPGAPAATSSIEQLEWVLSV